MLLPLNQKKKIVSKKYKTNNIYNNKTRKIINVPTTFSLGLCNCNVADWQGEREHVNNKNNTTLHSIKNHNITEGSIESIH